MVKKFLVFVAIFPCSIQAEDLGVRILLGLTDTVSKPWDGSVTAQGATVARIDPWRFEGAGPDPLFLCLALQYTSRPISNRQQSGGKWSCHPACRRSRR